MTAAVQDFSLEEIRRDIDAIDDRLLELLGKRIIASVRVRQVKSQTGTLASSPVRPAREAMILRRLMDRRQPDMSPDLLVRLWRVILTSSILAQAPVTVHMSRALAATGRQRALVAEHFCAIPVIEHDDELAVLVHLSANRGDLGVVGLRSSWADHLAAGHGGETNVIGILPVLKCGPGPELVVFGHAEAQPTGHDETIVLSRRPLPYEATVDELWQIQCGSYCVSCLSGFLPDNGHPLIALLRSDAALGLKIVGRYPGAIEVRS